MKTLGKVTDATVIVGSLIVGYGAFNALFEGIKTKNSAIITISGLTALITIYAFKEAMRNIKE
jgi:hypothetical protein